MPELPEVETTKKSLDPLLNHKIQAITVFQPKLRWQVPDNLAQLTDYSLTSVRRRAKYLLLDFVKDNDKKTLMVHLGMSGSLQQFRQANYDKRKHDHVIFTFVDSNNQPIYLNYHDPRRFGSILWTEDDNNYADKLLSHLGVEPLEDSFDVDYLYNYIHHKQRKPISKAIKSVIMEQKVVVGVGNIYASESLFLAKIHPACPANLISKQQLEVLIGHIKVILKRAIEQGGSSLKDFTVNGQTGYFQQTLEVYGRQNQACNVCTSALENVKINGRASVYCPICQPLEKT